MAIIHEALGAEMIISTHAILQQLSVVASGKALGSPVQVGGVSLLGKTIYRDVDIKICAHTH
jgi:hypothetical protein